MARFSVTGIKAALMATNRLVSRSGLFHNSLKLDGSAFTLWRRLAGNSPGQSQGKRRLLKPWGLKVPAGTEVMERDFIVNQRGLKYHPGLNVGIDPRDNALYAECDGILIVTTEKLNPNTSNELVQKYYANLDSNLFKRYVHVLPKMEEKVFRLIDVV